MAGAVADVATAHAAKYLVQLCKHWAHKLPVKQAGDAGRITLGLGQADLLAESGTLRITLTSPDAGQLDPLKDVVARHLVRFAFREELVFDWRDA
ncbi:DUF2218 domain-containing protein [Phenylobacterium sp. J367]|uniref:DUF2218 domain-containing protein n=1 Tax=Phenylobacterium sp. J367 TaxID=2898435 RepID=UPI002151116E|nr:DUF2218 domain-containing protein [Phenylobacterium sp. J367]MCR5879126.1 DUF2218 domain-containing protein [Phenylobacterium sp. J367]